MCDVTRDNFETLLPDIERHILNSSFIAFDAEFTGLTPHSNVKTRCVTFYNLQRHTYSFCHKTYKVSKFFVKNIIFHDFSSILFKSLRLRRRPLQEVVPRSHHLHHSPGFFLLNLLVHEESPNSWIQIFDTLNSISEFWSTLH